MIWTLRTSGRNKRKPILLCRGHNYPGNPPTTADYSHMTSISLPLSVLFTLKDLKSSPPYLHRIYSRVIACLIAGTITNPSGTPLLLPAPRLPFRQQTPSTLALSAQFRISRSSSMPTQDPSPGTTATAEMTVTEGDLASSLALSEDDK